MNKVIFSGRLAADPQISNSNNSTIAKFSLAVARRFKKEGQPDADFFNCTLFDKQAEWAEKYLKKGTRVELAGRLQNGSYTNKDGQKVYTTTVIVDEIDFGESNKSKSEDEEPAF